MQYPNIERAVFLSRPNRFIAQVRLADGTPETVHVKNTGRCKELLVPGCMVWLTQSVNPARKTRYDLIAVEKRTERGTLLINMDSMAPNAVVSEWLAAGGIGKLDVLHPEYKTGDSRFDFYAEQNGASVYIEVKGVTLEENGEVRFPDAPTLRGLKHIRELTELARSGRRCIVIFAAQLREAAHMRANREAQPEFEQALVTAKQAGVELLAYNCLVTPDSLALNAPIPLLLPCGEA